MAEKFTEIQNPQTREMSYAIFYVVQVVSIIQYGRRTSLLLNKENVQLFGIKILYKYINMGYCFEGCIVKKHNDEIRI